MSHPNVMITENYCVHALVTPALQNIVYLYSFEFLCAKLALWFFLTTTFQNIAATDVPSVPASLSKQIWVGIVRQILSKSTTGMLGSAGNKPVVQLKMPLPFLSLTRFSMGLFRLLSWCFEHIEISAGKWFSQYYWDWAQYNSRS